MDSARGSGQRCLFVSTLVALAFLAMSHCARDSTSGGGGDNHGGQNNGGSNGSNGENWIPNFGVTDPERFDAVKDFMDYVLSQGAEFITIGELVDWSQKNNR